MSPGYAISTDGGQTRNNNVWRIGKPVKITHPDGSYETFSWQQRYIAQEIDYFWELGRVTDEHIWAADLHEHVYVRDGATYTTRFSNYDAYGNPGTLVETGPNGGIRTTYRTYYNNTDKWIIGLPLDESYDGTSIGRAYDGNGKLIGYYRDGVVTDYSYDVQGNRATEIRPGGRQRVYSNYKLGIPQTEVQPEGITITRVVDNAGNIVSETNGEGHTTRYTYDGLNRVTSVIPPAGSARYITYTPTSKTDSRNKFSEVTQYDAFGRVASITRGGTWITRSYDAFGRIAFESDPSTDAGTRYQYDALGRIIQITNAEGSYQKIAYGAATRSVTNERGKVTTYTYRGYGHPDKQSLIAVTAPDPAANVTLTRDSLDRITSVTQGAFTRTYGYNPNGYLASVTNPETGTTVYGRDIAGNMTSVQVGASGITTFAYDGQNRQISITYPSGTPSVTKTYDKTGNLLVASSSGGTRSFTYDAAGNVAQERLSIDGKQFSLSYIYDGNDHLHGVTYGPSGRLVEYSPDFYGRPTMVSGFVNNVTYWPNGMLKRIAYANGTVTSFGQNARLWPEFFATVSKTGTEFFRSTYGYDGTGNLLGIDEQVDNAFDRSLSYDDMNRLVGVNGFWGVGTLAYDGTGNLIQQQLGATGLTYHYDAQNRLASVSGQRVANLGYDAYGNVSSSGGNVYTYNDVPNLVCVNCQYAASKVEYQYDGLNQRSSVSYAGNKVYEMQDSDGRLRMELDGGTLTEYIYLGDQRVAQVRP